MLRLSQRRLPSTEFIIFWTSRNRGAPWLRVSRLALHVARVTSKNFDRHIVWAFGNGITLSQNLGPSFLQRSKLLVIHGTRKFISKSCGFGGRSRENTLTIHIFNKYFFLIERSCDITLGNFSQVLNSGYVLTEVPDKSCANTKTISNKCHKINLSGLVGNFLFYVIPAISYLWAWTIETSSSPKDSMRSLIKKIEIFCGIIVSWFTINTRELLGCLLGISRGGQK